MGACTVTCAVLVLLPPELVAVSVKVVVAVTCAVALPLVTGDTEPTPWSMESVVAPVTTQASVTDPPAVGTVLGVAVKLVMVGPLPLLLLEHPANAKAVNTPTTAVRIETIRVPLKEELLLLRSLTGE
jgi:hypothetical protein